MKIETVRTSDFAMRYFRFGNADAMPLVVLPGLSVKSVMESADTIAGVFTKLGAHFDVYVMDRRSDLPEAYSMEDMAEDTAAAIKAIGLKEVFLYGVSQGGMMAQLIAVTHPELVRAMILASTTSRVEKDTEDMFAQWTGLARDGKTADLIDAFSERIYSPAFYKKYRKIFRMMASTVTKEDLSRFVILAKSMRGLDITGRLSSITCPVLVIAAEGDRVIPVEAAQRIAGAAGTEIYIYPGYSHAVYDEAADFQDRLDAFFGACRR